MKKIFVITALLIFGINLTIAQDTIHVDFNKVIKEKVNSGVGSVNLCWLLDSDLKRPNPNQSMQDAIKELGCGSLRFPYGHLADNYLWHTPPFDDTKDGLRPKVASMSQAPGQWNWAVNPDGSFKSAMDFDEYMSLCQSLDIKPLVVVNVFSFKYKNGPSFEELLETAVEWVKYAKQRNYHVEYWQIGNEVDHHPDVLSMEEYIECYRKITTAMKAVNPEINVGPGTLSKVKYFTTIVQNYPELIDFTSAHQYMWRWKDTLNHYEAWKDHQDLYIPNVQGMQEAVSKSAKPNMDIVVTETGLSPGKFLGAINNTYKALWYFEVLMNEISQPNVAYTYFWGTHSPWGGDKDDEDNDVAVLFRVDDNSRKPIAEVIKLVNENILAQMVHTEQFSGYVRTFASASENNSKCKVFLMNKSEKAQELVVKINGLPDRTKSLKRTELKGGFPESRTVTIDDTEKVMVANYNVKLTLAPLSITVLQN